MEIINNKTVCDILELSAFSQWVDNIKPIKQFLIWLSADLTVQEINVMQYHLILERHGRSQRLHMKLLLKALETVKIQQQQISKS